MPLGYEGFGAIRAELRHGIQIGGSNFVFQMRCGPDEIGRPLGAVTIRRNGV